MIKVMCKSATFEELLEENIDAQSENKESFKKELLEKKTRVRKECLFPDLPLKLVMTNLVITSL